MDAKFNLLMTGVFDQVGEKLDMLIKNVDKDDKKNSIFVIINDSV